MKASKKKHPSKKDEGKPFFSEEEEKEIAAALQKMEESLQPLSDAIARSERLTADDFTIIVY